MTGYDFENDWESAKEMGRFAWLHKWEIQSIRGYEGKKGTTVHVVFKLKEGDTNGKGS